MASYKTRLAIAAVISALLLVTVTAATSQHGLLHRVLVAATAELCWIAAFAYYVYTLEPHYPRK